MRQAWVHGAAGDEEVTSTTPIQIVHAGLSMERQIEISEAGRFEHTSPNLQVPTESQAARHLVGERDCLTTRARCRFREKECLYSDQ